jgi:hypothetical protein
MTQMTPSNDRFQPKAGQIVASVIDGETVIVDLANGNYYSMDGSGSEVWAMIEQRRPVAEMKELLTRRYGADAGAVSRDLDALIEKMLAEDVIEPAHAPASEAALDASDPTGAYQSPVFHAYRDMRDLLALDPPMPGLRDIPWKDPDHTA